MLGGVTYVDVKNWISIKSGIKLGDPNTIDIKFLAVKLKNNGNFLPIEAIIHTFIHELSHTITIPESHISKNILKKYNLLFRIERNEHLWKITILIHFIVILQNY